MDFTKLTKLQKSFIVACIKGAYLFNNGVSNEQMYNSYIGTIIASFLCSKMTDEEYNELIDFVNDESSKIELGEELTKELDEHVEATLDVLSVLLESVVESVRDKQKEQKNDADTSFDHTLPIH